jgi:hypothetical protein
VRPGTAVLPCHSLDTDEAPIGRRWRVSVRPSVNPNQGLRAAIRQKTGTFLQNL